MKIFFFLQRRWAMVGNAMAYHLKESIPDAEFCGLVQMRSSLKFLKEQAYISYSALILEEEIYHKLETEELDLNYIHWLEKEYGIPNLWPYLYIDRIVMHGQLRREYPYNKALLSYTDMMRLVQASAKAIIEFLDKEKPDVLIFSVIGSLTSNMLYHIAQKRGLQVLTIEHARIGNRIAYTETYKELSWVKERFEEIQKGRRSGEREAALQIIKEFQDKPAPYLKHYESFNRQAERGAHLQFLKPKKLLWGIFWHLRAIVRDLRDLRHSDHTDVHIWWIVWDKLCRKTRALIGYDDLYGKVDLEERFAYYPLHYDPEVATMLYAPFYTNQIEVVKAIARSLPLDMKLYVKEHAPMVGYRKRSYYKELLRIPNVKLINAGEQALGLIQKAELVVTITGTGGWEGVLLKKPVIAYQDGFFNNVPGVRHWKDASELPSLVKAQLEEWSYPEEDLINYISAILEDSVAVDYMDLWEQAETEEEIIRNEGIKALSKLLAEKIALRKKS